MADEPPEESHVETLMATILVASPGTPTLTCRRIAEDIIIAGWTLEAHDG